jgi:hypothetical protein
MIKLVRRIRNKKMNAEPYLYFFSVLFVFFASCKNESPKTTTLENSIVDSTVQTNTDIKNDSMGQAYSAVFGATINKINEMQVTYPIKRDQEFYFSNPETEDVFSLYIPMGKIGETRSTINITNSEKDLLYTDTLNTYDLVRYILYPERIPDYKNDKQRYEYQIQYMQSINEKDVNEYLEEKATAFYDHAFIDKSEVADRIKEDGNDQNKELFNEVTSFSNARIFCLMDYDSEEGVEYFGYSPTKKKAVLIFAGD